MGQGILITATDTGAGKTHVTCLLGRQLRRERMAVLPLKPVESGCTPDKEGRPFPADAAALRDAMAPGRAIAAVCLYPLLSVLSPHLAARLEGVSIDPAGIGQTVIDATQAADVVLVEGAGGITVEMRAGYSFADLARDVSMPVLVVAGNRLGVLNHLRLTIRYLQYEAIPLFGVILNDISPAPFPARESNEAEVRLIAGARYLGRVPYGATDLPEELFYRFREALSRIERRPSE